MAFPPVPRYPDAIDDDSTLFLVYNTTETKLTAENPAWAQEIDIVPVAATANEIWADNGFGNISGELFYYGSVEKNSDGKVLKLKDCARELGGSPSRWNKKGEWVRSYVVAEHHNQLVDAILKMEDFTGINFDERQRTLDWRIRNLEELAIIFDDHACPNVDFTFNTTETDKERGTLATYSIVITAEGVGSNTFRLDFGDGEFTTTELSGTHRYAINARIDPVVTVSNNKCQVIQTPIERANPAEPPPPIIDEFEVPFPDPIDVPDFTFVPCDVPEPNINIPPIVLPCADVQSNINIEIGDISIPSQITTIDGSIPSHITIDPVPSIIIIDPPIPPTIVIDPPIPPTIVIVPPESEITLNLDAAELPAVQVDWGAPPEMEVAMTMVRPVQSAKTLTGDELLVNEFGSEFADLFEAQGQMKVEYEPVGLPSEIKLVAPDMPKVELDTSGVPKTIKVDTEEANIPQDIKIHGPDDPIPTSINIVGESIPDEIDLVYKGGPIEVEVELKTEMPKSIKVEVEGNIPERIVVEAPEKIGVDMPSTITVEGIPDTIGLEIPENIGIPLILPPEMPQVEMVYKGTPVEVKISMDEIMAKDEEGQNCVMITPCPR